MPKKNKFKAFIQKNIYLILAFFIPATIHGIAFIVMNVYPFGNKSIMVIDNFHQYSPFLSEFKDILENGNSLLYSWNSGMGSNFWARYGYYLASPLNLLFVLFPQRLLPEFIVLLSLIRTGISGMTFFIYIRRKYQQNNFAGVAFAVLYAVSSYTLAYYWNIMWFDCIAVLPLIVLGIELLVTENKGILYCVTLAFAMYTNYYIALIICIFIIIYYLMFYLSLAPNKDFYQSGSKIIQKQHKNILYIQGFSCKNMRNPGFSPFFFKTVSLAGYSLLSAGLAAIILLPTYYALSVSQSAGASFPSAVEFYSNTVEILAGHLMNISPSVMSGMPNVYCGLIVVLLIPLYFMNSKISLREKICSGIFIAFFILSFNINYLNFIWHGLHFPNSLPFRFAFLYCFFLVGIAFKAFIYLDGVNRSAIFKSLLSALAVVLIVEKIYPDIAEVKVIYPSLLFLILNGVILLNIHLTHSKKHVENSISVQNTAHSLEGNLIKRSTLSGVYRLRNKHRSLTVSNKPHKIPAVISIVLLILIATEISINAGYGISAAGVGQRSNYMGNLSTVKNVVAEVENWKNNENDFFRMEFLKDTVSNTPSLYNYKGASYFSSTAIVSVTNMMEKLGLRPSSAWYIYKGSTPIINSLFSFRYLLSKEDTYNNPLYPLVDTIDDIQIYQNPYQLPLAFMVNEELADWNLTDTNVFAIQNDFIQRSTGQPYMVLLPVTYEEKSFENAEITSRNGNRYHVQVFDSSKPGFVNFNFKNPDKQMLYLYIRSRDSDYIWYIKDGKSEGHNIRYYPYIIDTQYFDATEEVEVSIRFEEKSSGEFEVYGCLFDENAFMDAYEQLSSQPFVIDHFSDTKITGTVQVEESGILLTTIPYDQGWRVKVDGERVPLEHIGKGFIILHLDTGMHNVEFSYIPLGFIPGLSISLISLAILIFIIILSRNERKQSPRQLI